MICSIFQRHKSIIKEIGKGGGGVALYSLLEDWMEFDIINDLGTVYKYKSSTAASCDATVMMVFNKGVSCKHSSKSDNKWRHKLLRRREMDPCLQILFTFSTNIQLMIFIQNLIEIR